MVDDTEAKPKASALSPFETPAALNLDGGWIPGQPVEFCLPLQAVKEGITTAVCPQCGTNPEVEAVKRTFTYVPRWVYVGLIFNIIILLLLYFVGRKVVKSSVTLCRDCDLADRKGRNYRAYAVLGLVVSLVAATVVGVLSLDASPLPIAILPVLALIAGIAGVVMVTRRTANAIILCKKIDKFSVTLLVSHHWKEVLPDHLSAHDPAQG